MPTAAEISKAVHSEAKTCANAIGQSLATIRQHNASLHAFLYVDGDRAMARAADLDARVAAGDNAGPLAGVPIAVKDNICTAFGTTTCGSRILDGYRSPYDATVVERLERAGATVVGKTNLDQFGMGSSTEHGAFGVTRNPWNLERVPGGSSGGSAAAVAAGMVCAALGSDTGGSVRQPASFCGVVGLKPSYGRVSRYGLVAYASSLDQIGVCTRSVEDAAMVLQVMAGHDDRDSTCADREVPDYLAAVSGDIATGKSTDGLRVGVPGECFGTGLDSGVRGGVEQAIGALVETGMDRVELSLPHLKYAIPCYYLIAMAEASSNLARFDGVRYGHRTERPADLHDMYRASRSEGFGNEVKRRIMLGTFALSAGYHDRFYLKAQQVRTLIQRDFDQAFEQVDVIATPVAPTTAFAIGEQTDDPLKMYLGDVYTVPANLAGLCAISLPCGLDEQGLPVGLQLIAPAFAEDRLLAIAQRFQRHTDHHLQSPPLNGL